MTYRIVKRKCHVTDRAYYVKQYRFLYFWWRDVIDMWNNDDLGLRFPSEEQCNSYAGALGVCLKPKELL